MTTLLLLTLRIIYEMILQGLDSREFGELRVKKSRSGAFIALHYKTKNDTKL